MKIARKWLEWAHGPGAESDQPLAQRLVDLAASPGRGAIEISDPDLIAEIVSVAELYCNPQWGDELFERGPWWRSQPTRLVDVGRAELKARNSTRTGEVR